MEEDNIMDQLQQHADLIPQSPLFEPEASDVPEDIMTDTPLAQPLEVSTHIEKLHAIEESAKTATASWNAGNFGCTIPQKRPGMQA